MTDTEPMTYEKAAFLLEQEEAAGTWSWMHARRVCSGTSHDNRHWTRLVAGGVCKEWFFWRDVEAIGLAYILEREIPFNVPPPDGEWRVRQ